ncbi:MAG: hypothetical protein HF978_14800 [Desulfobacteraceae bacterium]|nr:hypothetical protein [Desulfobacteraceae bacterium]MBC2756808.1 hypothetical protein [Desulfobacteraceae bacterium]
MNSFFTRFILLSIILLFFSPLNCICAEKTIPDEIAKALGPLEAIVIKAPEGRYLINMGTDKNVKKGSLWTIYSTGEQVIDPGTGKSLGVLPISLAVCRVKQVETHFSEISIKCLKEPCDIQSGLTAHRFRDIKTTFQDVNGSSFRLYELIRARLPSLDWQPYQRIENTSRPIPSPDKIVFVADNKNLTLWSGGEILAAYEKSPSVLSAFQEPTKKPELLTKKKANTSIQKNIPGVSRLTPGLNTTLEIENYTAVAGIDHPVTSMGIMTPDGSKIPYFIYLYNKTVYARAEDGTEKYQYDYKGFGDVVNMSLGHNGLIALNIYVLKEGMESRLLKFSSRGFTVLSKGVGHFLEFLDTDGNGIKESLVGQNFDTENFFTPSVFHLGVDDSGKMTRYGTINVPAGFNLPGAIFADLDGNGIHESAFYNAGGKLVIYEDDKQKWESSSPFVPVKSILIDDIINETNAPTDLPLWPQPVIFHIDNFAVAVIPANHSGFWRIVSGIPQNGGLGVLCSLDGTWAFRLLSTRFQGPVQSVCMYDNALYITVVEGNTFTGKGITHVLTVPIKDLKESLK